jgi:molecular chaperone GrpE (heat shock protein)
VIKNYQSLDEWVKKIKQLDENKDYYKKLSSKAKQHAGKFELEKETDRLLEVLRNIIAKNRDHND